MCWKGTEARIQWARTSHFPCVFRVWGYPVAHCSCFLPSFVSLLPFWGSRSGRPNGLPSVVDAAVRSRILLGRKGFRNSRQVAHERTLGQRDSYLSKLLSRLASQQVVTYLHSPPPHCYIRRSSTTRPKMSTNMEENISGSSKNRILTTDTCRTHHIQEQVKCLREGSTYRRMVRPQDLS